MNIISVNIRKPVYGNYVYLRSEILDRAIREKARLLIEVPAGRAIVDPAEWKRKGKVMKKVFKIPGHPMILYGGTVPVELKTKGTVTKPGEEKPKDTQASLFIDV